MCVRLVLLACGTAFDIFSHELHKTWPSEFSSNKLVGFEITQVTSSLMVVATGEDGVAEGIVWGDIDMTFVCQDVVVKFLV